MPGRRAREGDAAGRTMGCWGIEATKKTMIKKYIYIKKEEVNLVITIRTIIIIITIILKGKKMDITYSLAFRGIWKSCCTTRQRRK